MCKKIEGDDFDSLELESKYTKQALLVAIEAREKKRQMFIKKDDLMDTKNLSKTKTNIFTISKYSGFKMGDNLSSAKNRTMTQKVTVVPDLSLSVLTKEL